MEPRPRSLSGGKEIARTPSWVGMNLMTDCPECGLPAEVRDRFTLASTHGRIEHIRTVCTARHVRTVATDRRGAR
jgi:hypothetical protein